MNTVPEVNTPREALPRRNPLYKGWKHTDIGNATRAAWQGGTSEDHLSAVPEVNTPREALPERNPLYEGWKHTDSWNAGMSLVWLGKAKPAV